MGEEVEAKPTHSHSHVLISKQFSDARSITRVALQHPQDQSTEHWIDRHRELTGLCVGDLRVQHNSQIVSGADPRG